MLAFEKITSHDIFSDKNVEIILNLTIPKAHFEVSKKALLAGNKTHEIKSISHITGGGLIENPPRAFNKNLTIKFNMKNYELPPLFKWLQTKANISLFELLKTFNCGIGLLIFVSKKDLETVMMNVNKAGYNSFIIGSMIENTSNKSVIFDGWEL